jgi:hypothetical protein
VSFFVAAFALTGAVLTAAGTSFVAAGLATTVAAFAAGLCADASCGARSTLDGPDFFRVDFDAAERNEGVRKATPAAHSRQNENVRVGAGKTSPK